MGEKSAGDITGFWQLGVTRARLAFTHQVEGGPAGGSCGVLRPGGDASVRLSLGIQVEEGAARRRLSVTGEPGLPSGYRLVCAPLPWVAPRLLHAVHYGNMREQSK